MTPEQVERVRNWMLAALGAAEVGHYNMTMTLIGDALRSINGEVEEDWHVDPCDNIRLPDGTFGIRNEGSDIPFVFCRDEADARRIARLPALERAARDAARFLERSGGADPASEHETVREVLYAALTKTEA